MAENLTLARPYAEAAFALARDAANLPSWSDAMQRLAAVTRSPALAEYLGNPRIDAAQITALCLDVAGTKLTDAQQNFVRVLVDNDRLDVVPEMAELFEALRNAHEGVKDAEVTSAFPIADSDLRSLVEGLERKFNCRIQAKVNIDPSLIGGVRVAVGDEVIDASVRGKLAAMATAFKN